MSYKPQPVPFLELHSALAWEELRAAFFESRGNFYKSNRQDALLRAAGHRARIERGDES